MYIVGSRPKDYLNGQGLEMATSPYVHRMKGDAVREAERLAQLHPKKFFYVFKSVSFSEAVGVVTYPMED